MRSCATPTASFERHLDKHRRSRNVATRPAAKALANRGCEYDVRHPLTDLIAPDNAKSRPIAECKSLEVTAEAIPKMFDSENHPIRPLLQADVDGCTKSDHSSTRAQTMVNKGHSVDIGVHM